MRLRFSQKIFLIFSGLTLLTIVLGGIVAAGLRDLREANDHVRLLKDFQIGVGRLESFAAGAGHEPAETDAGRISEEVQRARELARLIGGKELGVSPALALRVEALQDHVDYFERAFSELTAKYRLERELHAQNKALMAGMLETLRSLPRGAAAYPSAAAVQLQVSVVHH